MGSFGKKTSNPGYDAGNHWLTCDVCGFVIRSEDARERWDGLVVCPEDWEIRHPQDFLRGREDDMVAKGLRRPEPEYPGVKEDLEVLTAARRVDRGDGGSGQLYSVDFITAKDINNSSGTLIVADDVPDAYPYLGHVLFLPAGGIKEGTKITIKRPVANADRLFVRYHKDYNVVRSPEFFSIGEGNQPVPWQDVIGLTDNEVLATFPNGAYQHRDQCWLNPRAWGWISRGDGINCTIAYALRLKGGWPVRSFKQDLFTTLRWSTGIGPEFYEDYVPEADATYTAAVRLRKDAPNGYFLFEVRVQDSGSSERDFYSLVVDPINKTAEPIADGTSALYKSPLSWSMETDGDNNYWLLRMTVKTLATPVGDNNVTIAVTPNFIPSLYGVSQFPDKHASVGDHPDLEFVVNGFQFNAGDFLEPYSVSSNHKTDIFFDEIRDYVNDPSFGDLFEENQTGSITLERIDYPEYHYIAFPRWYKLISRGNI